MSSHLDRQQQRAEYVEDVLKHGQCNTWHLALADARNPKTRVSHHETMVRLSRINSASVCYACPMLFDSEELYESANLASLRCIDLVSAPTGWKGNERHFLMFGHPADRLALWHSEPVAAPVMGLDEWASPARRNRMRKLSAQETLSLIEAAGDAIRAPTLRARRIPSERYPL